ncbi:MAG: diguanylate cyclase [Mycobacterium sp.]|nr:diguanylate cyclase [Mycobacterium sp.]
MFVGNGAIARVDDLGGVSVFKSARWRQPDHFYWLTAFLAARGAQSTTCRVLAATILVLGAIPVAMMWSPAGPEGPRDRLLAVTIAACCLVMALAWLRQRWPSRTRSGVFVVTSALCIAVGCLIVANPLAGLLGATAFATLGGYIAFFHTARYMAFNMSVAAVTTIILSARQAIGGDVVWAVCAIAFVAVVNISVPFACQTLVHLLCKDVLNAELDPLTGLLNRDTFYRSTGAVLASRSRDDDRYLVVVVVNLDNFRLLCDTDGPFAGDRARVAVAQTLRENTRHGTVVAHVGGEEFLISDTFASTDATPLVERVRSAIATTPPRLTASIGVVSTPLRGLAGVPPQDLLDELITIATKAMYDAGRAGGNQARHVVCAAPTVLDGHQSIDRFGTEDQW